MTFIVAEVGSNWTSFQDAKDSIAMAKQCGADGVKFQLYTHKELYGADEDFEISSSLPREWIPKLKEKADACGIEFMCTAFSPEGLKFIDPYVKRHKIASSEITHLPLLRAANKAGKPVIVSTGGASLGDIKQAIAALPDVPKTIMYCINNYPATNVNLFHIDSLYAADLVVDVGYSCHTTDWYTAVSAVKHHGAKVIEKHFKLREMDTPDSPHSILPAEFKKMVEAIRGVPKVSFPDPQEKPALLRHKRRLIATKAISPGQIFEYGVNYGVYRSLKDDVEGLSGFAVEVIAGKECKIALQPGDAIGPKAIS